MLVAQILNVVGGSRPDRDCLGLRPTTFVTDQNDCFCHETLPTSLSRACVGQWTPVVQRDASENHIPARWQDRVEVNLDVRRLREM